MGKKTQDRLVSAGQKGQCRAEVEGKEEKAMRTSRSRAKEMFF